MMKPQSVFFFLGGGGGGGRGEGLFYSIVVSGNFCGFPKGYINFFFLLYFSSDRMDLQSKSANGEQKYSSVKFLFIFQMWQSWFSFCCNKTEEGGGGGGEVSCRKVLSRLALYKT